MAQSQVVDACTVANLRDLGGIRLPDGRTTRPGVLFRSAQLDQLDLPGDPVFAALGIRTVVDLRTARERTIWPDRVPPGAYHLVADVLADADGEAAAARLGTILADPRAANRELHDGRAEEALTASYRSFVLSDSGRRAYRELLTAAARPDSGPLLFHCTAGKDRTGWATTLILLLLGAEPATVREEYLAVRPAVHAMFAPAIEDFLAAGGLAEISDAVLDIRPAYLEAALETMASRWGDAETYARAALGLDDALLDRLRGHLAA